MVFSAVLLLSVLFVGIFPYDSICTDFDITTNIILTAEVSFSHFPCSSMARCAHWIRLCYVTLKTISTSINVFFVCFSAIEKVAFSCMEFITLGIRCALCSKQTQLVRAMGNNEFYSRCAKKLRIAKIQSRLDVWLVLIECCWFQRLNFSSFVLRKCEKILLFP